MTQILESPQSTRSDLTMRAKFIGGRGYVELFAHDQSGRVTAFVGHEALRFTVRPNDEAFAMVADIEGMTVDLLPDGGSIAYHKEPKVAPAAPDYRDVRWPAEQEHLRRALMERSIGSPYDLIAHGADAAQYIGAGAEDAAAIGYAIYGQSALLAPLTPHWTETVR